MKVNDLIKELKRLKNKHGNLEVRCHPYGGQPYSSLPTIEIWPENFARNKIKEKTLGIKGI